MMSSPLYYAAMNGHADACGLLLDMGAEHGWYWSKNAPLLTAVKNGHTDATRLLLYRGVNKDIQPYKLMTHTTRSGSLDTLKLVWDRSVIDAHLANIMYMHAIYADAESIKEWLNEEYDIRDIEDREYELLSRDIDLYDPPFRIAVDEGYVDVAQVFLDIADDDMWANRAFRHMVCEGNWDKDMMRMLVKNGVAINLEPEDEYECERCYNVLHYTVSCCSSYYCLRKWEERIYIEKVKFLLELGANVNTSTEDNWVTALHMAAGNGCIAMVQLLLDNGADVDYKDIEGNTPIQWTKKSSDVYDLLLKYGATEPDSD